MLHVENLVPVEKPISDSAFFRKMTESPAKPLPNMSTPSRLFEVTYRAVELDGSSLWREQTDVVIGQLAEAIRLADLREKSELKINNIAPWIEVGSTESYQVPILQKKIQRHLADACKKLKRRMPECRLSLTHGNYGIRCYLGRHKPTDHVYNEDFVSDSR